MEGSSAALTATHVVSAAPHDGPGPKVPGQVYARVMEVRGGAALVHVYGTATSQDFWVKEPLPAGAQGPAAAAPAADTPHRVSIKWLVASAQGKELFPWEDWAFESPCAWFLMPKPTPAADAAAAADEPVHKKARTGAPGAPSAMAIAAFAGAMASSGGGAVQRPSVGPLPEVSARRTENISQGYVAPGALPAVAPPAAAAGDKAAAPARVHVPAHASWFSFEAIHEVERKAMPEFFTDARGPLRSGAIYQQIRNTIIQRWRAAPGQRLTFTACRGNMVGEVNLLRKVFTQLQNWGLINNHVDKGGLPSSSVPVPVAAPPLPTALAARLAAPEGVGPHGQVAEQPHQAPRQALYHFTPAGVVYGPTAALGAALEAAPPAPAAAAAAAAALRQGLSICCTVCGCELSGGVWYHCIRVPDFYLCAPHHAEGRFPGDTAPGDFVRHTSDAAAAAAYTGGPTSCAGRWSDAETLLLVDGVTAHGEDWAKVATHVGTKSKAQCVAQFLALPIQERFLNDMEGRPPGGDPAMAAIEYAVRQVTPFHDAGNPILAQCAFMAAVVGPRVAAAAAASALAALEHEDTAAAAAAAANGAMDTGRTGFTAGAVERSLAVCLAGGAVKAKMLADQEERDMHRTMVGIVDAQAKKVEAKVKVLLELDDLIRRDTALVDAAQATATAPMQ
jgi:SWI/SNF related-matrix-associated actin-dependent regulator of chromatin subfamily C